MPLPAAAAAPPVPTLPVVGARAWAGRGDLAFVSLGALYVLDGTTGKLALVAGEGAAPSAPQFSPDGKWLSYSLSSRGGVGLARADGSAPRTVVASGEGGGWLPDGQLVAAGRIYSVSAYGKLTVSGRVPADLAAWAPDGSLFAFVTSRVTRVAKGTTYGVNQIWAAPSLSGKRSLWYEDSYSFTEASGYNGNAIGQVAVLPSGHGLIFWLDPYHSASIAADGLPLYWERSPLARPELLGVTVGPNVSIAPDGALAVGAGPNRYAWVSKWVEVCPLRPERCARVETRPGELSLDPAWSPAGTLAFVEAKAETAADFFPSTVKHWYSTRHLFVLGPGSARPVEVAGTQGAAAPTWSCDGKSLLFVSGDALWLLPRLGQAPVRVAWPLRPPSDWGSYYGEVDWASGFAWSGGYGGGGRRCSSSQPLRTVT
jgi:hypothetical protein